MSFVGKTGGVAPNSLLSDGSRSFKLKVGSSRRNELSKLLKSLGESKALGGEQYHYLRQQCMKAHQDQVVIAARDHGPTHQTQGHMTKTHEAFDNFREALLSSSLVQSKIDEEFDEFVDAVQNVYWLPLQQ